MARYCFLENRRELFAEACLRGWLAALLDFPRRKSREEATRGAQSVPDDLRSEVCCIPGDDEYVYRCLTISGFVAAYVALSEATEREIALMVAGLRAMPYSEALAFLRDVYTCDSGLGEVIDEAFTQFKGVSE